MQTSQDAATFVEIHSLLEFLKKVEGNIGKLVSGPVALLYLGSLGESQHSQDMTDVFKEFNSLDDDILLVHFHKDTCDEISGKIMPQLLAEFNLDQYEFSDFLLLSKDCTTYVLKLEAVDDMKQFVQSAQEDLAKIQMFKHYCKSGPRAKDDMEPLVPNCWRVTAQNFEEIVLNPECDVFVQEFANWCPWCVLMHPYINDLAWVT